MIICHAWVINAMEIFIKSSLQVKIESRHFAIMGLEQRGCLIYCPFRRIFFGQVLISLIQAAAPTVVTHIVTFEPDRANGVHKGGGDLTQIVAHGDNATPPLVAHRDYTFTGWFTAPNGEGTQWNTNSTVTDDITLYAGWVARSVPFQVGDVNYDTRITSADATIIARYLVGYFDHYTVQWLPLPICLIAANISGSGTVTTADITLLARRLVGHTT